MNQYIARLWASLLALSLLLSLAACGGGDTTATTMRLQRTEGTVAVSDGGGKDVPLLENLGLYSGYGVDTRSESYAWINLDDVKLTKMDQDSEITIQKEGKALEIEVKSGSLFFNVTQPLEDDETMSIRASTMLVGIRGTCGWVEVPDAGHMNVYLLEGKVECTVAGETAIVAAGEVGHLNEAAGTVVVEPFAQDGIPAFARGELNGISLDSIPETMEPAIPAGSEFVGRYIQHVEPHVMLDIELAPDGTLQAHWTADVFVDEEPYFETVEVYRSEAQVVGETLVVQVPADSGTAILTLAMQEKDPMIDIRGDYLMVTMQGEDSMITEWWAVSEIAGPYITLDSPTPDADTPESETLPTDGDRVVFTGTINRYTYDELLALQGLSDPNPGPYNVERDYIFQIIVLDTPQDMTLMSGSGDGSWEGTVSLISVTSDTGVEQYDGQHLIFSIDPSNTRWPSDVSAPFGEPRTSDIHVLGQA